MSLETIKNLKAKMAAVRAEMKKVGRDALQEAFAEFFNAHPDVEAINWQQYTDYFCDGDPCYFGMHGLQLELTQEAKKVRCLDEGEDEDYLKWNEGAQYSLKNGDALKVEFNTFKSAVEDTELFEMVFGDHKRISATRNGFDVEDYSDHN